MIRKAEYKDISRITELLKDICLIHHSGRPDIFKIGTKYTEDELKKIIDDPDNIIFVYTNSSDLVLGYCFTQKHQVLNDNILTDIKTLYIDDLCVEKTTRGLGIGKKLYEFVKAFAKENGYYNLTLNVWECNPNAKKFYDALGLKPMKTYLEELL
ncbi:MAG: GNAT family N-acetyltransferase [Acholeplasmatales bacterium]|nr:GNAT family N-acetyltransferase [Acholeplasmatales bacterium]